METKINVLKLHRELEAAGLPVCSVRDSAPEEQGQPVADYTRPLSAVEQDQAAAVILAHDPSPDPEPVSDQVQITALASQVNSLQASLDLVTSKMLSASLVTAEELQAAGVKKEETGVQTVT